MGYQSLFSLADKIILVTGCASGIGQGIAVGLARAHATIIGFDLASMDETATMIQEVGGSFTEYTVDLADSAAIQATWKRVENNGGVDVLFNNAGIQHREAVESFDLDKLDQIIAVNMRAPYLLCQLAAQHFLATKKRGKIINTASLFSLFGGMNVSGYTATKHAIMGITRSFANELGPRGICVNALAPGYVATEITRNLWSDSEVSATILNQVPLGRWATPEDYVGSAIFLASAASDYVNGALLVVDGGFSIR